MFVTSSRVFFCIACMFQETLLCRIVFQYYCDSARNSPWSLSTLQSSSMWLSTRFIPSRSRRETSQAACPKCAPSLRLRLTNLWQLLHFAMCLQLCSSACSHSHSRIAAGSLQLSQIGPWFIDYSVPVAWHHHWRKEGEKERVLLRAK